MYDRPLVVYYVNACARSLACMRARFLTTPLVCSSHARTQALWHALMPARAAGTCAHRHTYTGTRKLGVRNSSYTWSHEIAALALH